MRMNVLGMLVVAIAILVGGYYWFGTAPADGEIEQVQMDPDAETDEPKLLTNPDGVWVSGDYRLEITDHSYAEYQGEEVLGSGLIKIYDQAGEGWLDSQIGLMVLETPEGRKKELVVKNMEERVMVVEVEGEEMEMRLQQ